MDTPLMQEARELIAFYDERGWKWDSSLAFIMVRGWIGGTCVYNPQTHFAMPKRHKEK